MLGVLMVWDLGVLVYGVSSLTLATLLYLIDYKETSMRAYTILASITSLLIIGGLFSYFGLHAPNIRLAKTYYKIFTLITTISLMSFYMIPRKGLSAGTRKILDVIYWSLSSIIIYDTLTFDYVVVEENNLFLLVRDSSIIGLFSSILNAVVITLSLTIVLKDIVKNSIIKQRRKVAAYLLTFTITLAPIYAILKTIGGKNFSLAVSLYLFFSILWLFSSLVVQIDPYIYLFSPNNIHGIAILVHEKELEFRHFKDNRAAKLIEEGVIISMIEKDKWNISNKIMSYRINEEAIVIINDMNMTIIIVGDGIDHDIIKVIENSIIELHDLLSEQIKPSETLESVFYIQTEKIIKKLF